MEMAFKCYFCNSSTNGGNHSYLHIVPSTKYILTSDKILGYEISVTENNFSLIYKDDVIYNSFNEDLIYWTSLEELKIKLDKIMIFQ